jgi:L-2-hydroxyglutarate oxidase LhgO
VECGRPVSQIEAIDSVVIGGGVVGLAVARALARTGREVVVLEALKTIGSVTSARNSEVIHAGIYYPPGSLKARLCMQGRRALYDYCEARNIAHRRCGKLVVATQSSQLGVLEALLSQAAANGADDLELIGGHAVRALEPALTTVAALHSPSTGIVDSHGLMLALRGDAEAAGAMFAFRSPLESARISDNGLLLNVGGAHPMRIRARQMINAAGLNAVDIASRTEGLEAEYVPTAHFCKGSYFSLAGRAPFSHLIYPVPKVDGLGLHLTLDLSGQARFGPDIEWLPDALESIDYSVDPARDQQFYAAIRQYWPALVDGALQPAYSGVRPKLHGPGHAAIDFVLSGPAEHGIPGLVNLFGIESPGLTAALAIGDLVRDVLCDD